MQPVLQVVPNLVIWLSAWQDIQDVYMEKIRNGIMLIL